jgi:hypothetical protein
MRHCRVGNPQTIGGIELRKVMLLAAIMAMVLAAAAPAFAQATATGGNVEYADCDQVQAAANTQYANDTGNLAAIAADQGITQEQVLACLDSAAAGDITTNVNVASAGGSAGVHTVVASGSAGGGGGGGGGTAAAGSASAAAGGALPDTGGASLFALGAGALLVAGGLLARRIVR